MVSRKKLPRELLRYSYESRLILIIYVAQICFNYLQQQFYLVTPSMKQLAKGKNEEVILKLLKNLVGSTQGVRLFLTNECTELS
jgi:hypothetical protein